MCVMFGGWEGNLESGNPGRYKSINAFTCFQSSHLWNMTEFSELKWNYSSVTVLNHTEWVYVQLDLSMLCDLIEPSQALNTIGFIVNIL